MEMDDRGSLPGRAEIFPSKTMLRQVLQPIFFLSNLHQGSLLGVKELGHEAARRCKSTTQYNFKLQYLIKHNFVFFCP
jgi:hypothetical protein